MDRSTNVEGRGYRSLIGAASLAVGPLVMAVGDLLHPQETSDTGGQAVIIAEHATRWYLAHPLLLTGLVLFVPGLLNPHQPGRGEEPAGRVHSTRAHGDRDRRTAAIFVAELLAGRLGSVGAAAGAQAQAGRGMAETPWFPGCWPRPRLLVCSVSEPSHQGAPR